MTPQPVALPTGRAVVPTVGAVHGSEYVVSVWAVARSGAAKTMITVQQRSVKATFFRVVRAVAGIRSLFMGNALFSLVRVRRFALMAHSYLGNFPLARNKKLEIRNWKSET
jgi:hypothetical protein